MHVATDEHVDLRTHCVSAKRTHWHYPSANIADFETASNAQYD
jgi:hypothetical protein